jgi:GT2 family glycosyltransferase
MKVDCMIVSKDRPSEIALLLQSLRTQKYLFRDVYIMDDRSGVPYNQYHFINCIINQLKLDGHNVIIWRNEIPLGVTRLRQQVVEKILEYSDFEALLRLDDDNLLEPDYIERLVKCLEQGYDIASGLVPPCGFGQIKRETKFVKPFIADVRLNEKGEIVYFGDDCGHLYLEKEIIPSVNFRSMALIKREVHEKVKYEDNLGFCSFREEQFFSFRALLEGFKICVNTGAVAFHLNCPSGGERTQNYYQGLQNNHELLNKKCQKWFKEKGDFLENYRRWIGYD